MTNLAISNNITPGDKITFRLVAEFFGYGDSEGGPDIEFIAPKACPLINKVDNVFYKSKIVTTRKLSPKSFNITKYARPSDYRVGNSHYKLKFTLSSPKAAGDLKNGDQILFSTGNAKIINLNNKTYEVIASSGNDNRSLITLKIKNSDGFPTTLPSSTATGTLTEVNKVTKVQEFTVSVPKTIYENLVAEKDPKAPRVGDVEDIIIYAYKRYNENNDASVKKKLMLNNNEVNEQTPPSRSSIVDYRNKNSFSKQFEIDDEKNIEFYITVARYIYSGTGWNAKWLQINTAGNAIWKRAKKG